MRSVAAVPMCSLKGPLKNSGQARMPAPLWLFSREKQWARHSCLARSAFSNGLLHDRDQEVSDLLLRARIDLPLEDESQVAIRLTHRANGNIPVKRSMFLEEL